MRTRTKFVLLGCATVGMGVASACQKATAPAAAATIVSQADATAAADATQAAWTSMDKAKIESVYAQNVVAFDPADPPLSTTWENWDKLQAGFAAMKFDHMSAPDRNIQLLDADTFIVSGTGDMTSSTGTVKQATMRFTDVYRRQADGRWLIVNEHVSMKPTASGA